MSDLLNDGSTKQMISHSVLYYKILPETYFYEFKIMTEKSWIIL